MNKHITAVVAESGAYHDLQIGPGTTTRDIRTQLNLGEHYLISKRGNEPFGEDENIYGSVADGEKLFLSTPVEVGAGEFSFVSRLFPSSPCTDKVGRVYPPVINPSPVRTRRSYTPLVRKPIVVQRDSRPYWQQRGWTASGDEFMGFFRTPFGSWKGKAKVSPSGRVELFIQYPPAVLERHSHWTCFRWRFGGWYFVHTNEPIEDLSSGILAIENILTEAHLQ